ncbi:helix-turn-helix domain-containing protein [Kitasatospora aureofaciens]|uniref:helix-turn-helix domain-containing protein n=1 Tax=Kitasatospora aureofaciens TaxID=1894 RepID=UPI0033A1B421
MKTLERHHGQRQPRPLGLDRPTVLAVGPLLWPTQLRLHRALVLLARGQPVTAVAHRRGCSSASAFIDVFRRTFGHTPGNATTTPGRAATAPNRADRTPGNADRAPDGRPAR